MSRAARASGADDPRSADGADAELDAAEEPHPKGTFLLSIVFLLVLAGAWLLMYITLIERS